MSLVLVFLFVLPSVLVGLWVGYYIAQQMATHQEQEVAEREREATLKALLQVLQNTERLTTDVGSRNQELAQVGRRVEDLQVSGELEDVQQEVLRQIALVIQSNKQLENDLVYARFQLEEQAEELDRTRAEARTDALSGAYNRKAFDETVQYLLSGLKRGGDAFTLVLCDVDRFKWINDTHGHAAGDKMVANVGAMLTESVRSDDYVARYGGDEFAILLRSSHLEGVKRTAHRIRTTVARQTFSVGPDGELVSVTLSMGLAVARREDSVDSLIERADRALYESKHQGRNQLHAVAEQGELVKVEV